MIIHHNTKLGKKWLSGSGDTERAWLDTQRKYKQDKQPLTFWTFAVTLTFNAIIPFFNRTLWLMILYYQTKFCCKLTNSLEDTTEIIIFWLYKPLLWPGHWTQWTIFSTWHSSLWCCIAIPGLVTKCSMVRQISSGQTFADILNLHCDLDLDHRNLIFPKNTPAYDAVLLKQVWLQKDQQFIRYSKNSQILLV